MIVTAQIVFCFLKEALILGLHALMRNYDERESDQQPSIREDTSKSLDGSTTLVQSKDHLTSDQPRSSEYSPGYAQADSNTSSLFAGGENWDDDEDDYGNQSINSQRNDIVPQIREPTLEHSDSKSPFGMTNTYKNGVSGSNGLFPEEALSTYSSDSDALVENSDASQDNQTDASYVNHCVNRSLHFVSERDWLDELESLYYSGMIAELKLLLSKAFEASRDCFDFVIFVVKFADFDIQSGKKSLAYLTVVEFEAWLKSKTEGRSIQEIQLLGYWPSDKHKDLALEAVVTATFLVFEPVKRTFHLDSGENSFLTKHVRFLMHSKRRYKEAANIAYKLNLQRHFEMHEILLPLVILDKLQLAESYVAGCPTSLQLFMKMLDELCGVTDEELEVVVDKTVSPRPKDHRLKNKIIVKLGERLVKMFHLKAEDYPNIYKEKNLSGLRYLLQKKYSEKRPLSQKWDNLIETALGSNTWLQHKLIESLVEFSDLNEAARWAMFYALPLDSVPTVIRETLQSWQTVSEDVEDWECGAERRSEPKVAHNASAPFLSTSTNFYKLPFSHDRIHLVDNSYSLKECMRVLCVPGSAVGFDAEWKPTMCRAGTEDRLAIIQLSTWSEVFILDMIALTDNVKEQELKEFADNFFASRNVLKLGYGVDSDVRVLDSSCPPFKNALTNMARFVDLCPLSKEILKIPSVQQKLGSRLRSVSARERACIEEERGLSELVFLCLGLPLDKTYQISDWERRPLSDDQLIYAALDAYCLLEVYEVLKDWVRESRLRVNMEPELVLGWLRPQAEKPRRKRPKPGTTYNNLLPPPRAGKPIPPQSLRVVVDTMLQGLGQQLRCCGVDVVILDNSSDHCQAGEIARSEDRIILTSGLPYDKLRLQVPEGRCVCVPSGNTRQQVSALMRHFNVKVKQKDIFSRCQVCNGRDFVQVHQDHMRLAIGIFHGHFQPPSVDHVPQDCPIDLTYLTLPGGVPLRLGPLPEGIVDSVDIFFCCAGCGKVFWEGGHHKRVTTQFSYVLDRF